MRALLIMSPHLTAQAGLASQLFSLNPCQKLQICGAAHHTLYRDVRVWHVATLVNSITNKAFHFLKLGERPISASRKLLITRIGGRRRHVCAESMP